jgi:putative transposase
LFKFLIRDWDNKSPKHSTPSSLGDGTRVVKTPVQSPRANAIAERWVGSARRKRLDRMLIAGGRHLRLIFGE